VESFDEKPRCLVLFEESCRSEFTKKAYLFELKKFLKYAKMDYEQVLFLEKTELTDLLVDYVLHLKKRVSPNSIPIFFAGIFKFFEMNDREFNKRKIRALYGEKVKRSGFLPIKDEQINAMMKVCQNQKQRALLYLFSSTGCRPQAIVELKMKHLEPIGNGCLSLRLYDGSLHEMYSFLHEKATNELKKYFEWREKQGEKLTPESYVFVNSTELMFLTVKPLQSTSIGSILSDLIEKAGITRTKVNTKNYDLSSTGGFRKRFNTILKMNPNIAHAIGEMLMDHSNYLEKHYFKPTREQLFAEFQKAIPELEFDEAVRLKIENENKQKHIEKLESEKDIQMKDMQAQIDGVKELLKRKNP
jgi:integrase/recombinase XerD